MKLSDVVKIIPKFDKYGDPLPFFTKTEKQQIEGAPEGITQEKQLFDLIVGLDLPITDKIGLLGEFGFVDFRNRIEKDDQELGLASFDDNRKKIGIRYGGDDDSLSGRVMYDPDTKNISLGISKKFSKGGITSLAKGGRVNYQDGTKYEDLADQAKFNIQKAKFNIQKGIDDLTGIGSIQTDFPGSFDAASGVPSDFRHQAAANLLAETLGKGAYKDPILGPISYASGAIGSAGLGFGKEVIDLAKGLMDPNLTKKEAFSEFLKDNLSNIKGAFKLPGTTTEQLYDEIMGDYGVKPNLAFNPLMMNLKADRARQIEEARKRALKNIQNQRDSKPTTTVTGTRKPGTPGPTGRDSKPTTGGFSAPTKQGQSPRGTTTSSPRQTAREDRRGGQYGFASGGLARMLGE
tara:strand:+ start:94 stop:1308 length:1215 start_codon:yes stop_codon:yes gene_type:complete